MGIRDWIAERPIWTKAILAFVLFRFLEEVAKGVFFGPISDAIRDSLLSYLQRGPAMTGAQWVTHLISFVICFLGVSLAFWLGRLFETEIATGSKSPKAEPASDPTHRKQRQALKILIGSNQEFDQCVGRLRFVNVLLYNDGMPRIDGIKLYRTLCLVSVLLGKIIEHV